MASNVPFIRWLAAQRLRDDPIGDVARDIQHDRAWPRNLWTLCFACNRGKHDGDLHD